MSNSPDEARHWEESNAQGGEQALDDLRRGLERAHEQVRHYRQVLQQDRSEEA